MISEFLSNIDEENIEQDPSDSIPYDDEFPDCPACHSSAILLHNNIEYFCENCSYLWKVKK